MARQLLNVLRWIGRYLLVIPGGIVFVVLLLWMKATRTWL